MGRVLGRLGRNWKTIVIVLACFGAFGATGAFTLGGFSATIGNNANTLSSATVQLEEGNGTTTCFSTGTGSGGTVSSANADTTCSISVFSGTDLVPGGATSTATITLTNVGNQAATLASLVTGACSVAAAADDSGYVGSDTSGFCGKVDVTVANTTSGATDKCVYPTQAGTCPALSNTYTLAGLAGQTYSTTPMSALAAGASATYTITVQLDASATNADQGLAASMPFTWSISQ